MSFPEFVALDNLLHDDEEYVKPTSIEVFYKVEPAFDMLGVEVPGATLSLRFRAEEYQPRLRGILQTYVDGLSNSAAAWFLFRNRVTKDAHESKHKPRQIAIKVPQHIVTAVYTKIDENAV